MSPERARQWCWSQRCVFGTLVVVMSEAGVVRLALPATRLPARAEPVRDAVVAAQLDEYSTGTRRRFDVPVDLSAVRTPFHRRVYETLVAEVGRGETVSYGELAEMAGRPRAARAVGTAMAGCPVSVIIPCHRVVAADGIGGYGGGSAGVTLKRRLLEHEGVHLP